MSLQDSNGHGAQLATDPLPVNCASVQPVRRRKMRVTFVVVWIGPVRYVALETPRGLAFIRGRK